MNPYEEWYNSTKEPIKELVRDSFLDGLWKGMVCGVMTGVGGMLIGIGLMRLMGW